jgi:NADH dehydrogenase
MEGADMTLVIGASGMLGGEICRLLAEKGRPSTGLVRATSDLERVARLTKAGAGLAYGDLKDRASLQRACRGVTTVISTASSTLSRQPGDSIAAVDRDGQLALVDAAEAAGVAQFIFISFPSMEIEFPLQDAKRAVEARLRASRLTHTILQPTYFDEIWLGPALGFDIAAGRARIYGAGTNKGSWISFRDVAAAAVAAIGAPAARNATLRLGGPEALGPLEVVHLAEAITGRTFVVEHVPEEALRAQYEAATDPLQQSFAALMLSYARGDVVEYDDAARALGLAPFTSVREYLTAATAAPAV